MKQNQDVLEVEVEEISFEGELQNKITKELVKRNVTDAVISKLKDEFSGLKLKSPTDKESYLQLKEGRLTVRKVEILGEKAFKKLKEYPNQVRNFILDKEKEFANKFSVIYPNLDEGIKTFEDEQERIEQQERQRKESEFQNRQATLIKYGAQYNNGSFELNHISYEVDNIRECDEEVWNDIVLPKYKGEFEKVQAEIVRQENERKAAALKLKEEQDALNKEREEMNKQRQELAQAQAAMQKLKDDAEKEKQKIEYSEKIKKDQEEEKRWRNRLSELLDIRFNSQEAFYDYDNLGNESGIVATYDQLVNWDNETFEKAKKTHNDFVLIKRKESEEKRISDAETKRKSDIEAALQIERDRVAKQKEDEEIKEQQEKKRKQDELDASSDKSKWEAIFSSISMLSIHEMKSSIYKRKVSILKEKIEEIKAL
jgi:hypothetical protein